MYLPAAVLTIQQRFPLILSTPPYMWHKQIPEETHDKKCAIQRHCNLQDSKHALPMSVVLHVSGINEKNDNEFTVLVIPNIKCRTNYRHTPKPVLNLLGGTQRLTFVIENGKVMVKTGKK